MFQDNENLLQNNWQYLKNEVLKRWNRLAEADVENAHGNLQALSKLVEKEYGVQGAFKEQIQDIYDKCKNSHFNKNSRPVHAGQRDNSAERKLNENFSRTNSPSEVDDDQTDSPTIFEEGSDRKIQ